MSLEQYSKATKETAENLRIIDDAMFRLVVERKGVCQEILRTLLDKPQLRVVQVTSQSVMTSLHREITLDALCILENDEYVNIEMQKGSGNDDIRRTRFHAAATTAAYTPKGTDFSDIPYVTVLYITEYDALQTGQAITYVKRCMKTKEGFVKFSNLSKAVKYFKEKFNSITMLAIVIMITKFTCDTATVSMLEPNFQAMLAIAFSAVFIDVTQSKKQFFFDRDSRS